MRIVFMGTSEFAVPSLAMLLAEGYDVAAVVTQPDRPKGRGNIVTPPPVKKYAVENNLRVLQPEKIKNEAFIGALKEIGPDLVVIAAYGKILPRQVLDIPPLGCINVHGSLLPKYRGAAPIQWAVINGETVTGVTTMFTDEGMDTGDMLLWEETEITEDMTAGELHDKLSLLGAKVLKETLKKLEEGTLKRFRQSEEDATYAPIITKDVGKIDWNKTSRQIHNLVRGVNPWPGAFTFYMGKRVRIWKTRVVEGRCDISDVQPGQIVDLSKNGMVVVTGEGLISVLEIQFDSSKRMPIEECWHNLNEGEVLG